MDLTPTALLEAASFDWETLLPILFFVLYGIAQFVGSRKKPDEEVDEEPDSGQQQVDPLEKARQIREEIKRKIEERTQPAPQAERSSQTQQREAYDPYKPESPAGRTETKSRTFQPGRAESQKRSIPHHEEPPIGAPEPGEFNQTDIQKRLREQQRRLQEARRRQREAKQQARKMEKQAAAKVPRQLTGPPVVKSLKAEIIPVDSPARLRTSLIRDLRDPSSLRKAVLLREVLDPPLGLRK